QRDTVRLLNASSLRTPPPFLRAAERRANEIGDRRTAMRPRQRLHADRVGHDRQRFRTEAIGSHTDDPPVRNLETMDLVEPLAAVERSETDDQRLTIVLRQLPSRSLAEAERGHHHVRVLEERLRLVERVELDAADELAGNMFVAERLHRRHVLL